MASCRGRWVWSLHRLSSQSSRSEFTSVLSVAAIIGTEIAANTTKAIKELKIIGIALEGIRDEMEEQTAAKFKVGKKKATARSFTSFSRMRSTSIEEMPLLVGTRSTSTTQPPVRASSLRRECASNLCQRHSAACVLISRLSSS